MKDVTNLSLEEYIKYGGHSITPDRQEEILSIIYELGDRHNE